ncbi:MAG: rhamnulokinase [Lacisediminihabitans sp.]
MLGYVGRNELRVRPVARFPNHPVRTIDGLHWNILELYRNALGGLASAIREEPDLTSVAVDSWAADYALLRGGRMLGNPYHYRDERNVAAVDSVHARVSAAELYAANGLQHLSFNTLYQLAAEQLAGGLEGADTFLLIPDLIAYWLTGRQFAERTNASTTGLLNVQSREWDDALIQRLGLPRGIFPELVEAGTSIGGFLPGVAAELGASAGIGVSTAGSHDTASAVVAIPTHTDDFAYISCGTWGLVGVELDAPVLSEAGRRANFTNEGGVDGRVRYLHNVMGLWLLSESVRSWERDGTKIDLPTVLAQAAAVVGPVAVFDANDPRFLAPGDMPARIAEYCAEGGVAAPRSRAEFVRSIIESLSCTFARAVNQASSLSGKTVAVIHIVGGGSQNELLCQLTADRSGLPVLAGPVEATAIGNVLVQARTQGLVTGSLEALRAIVATAFPPKLYQPRAS